MSALRRNLSTIIGIMAFATLFLLFCTLPAGAESGRHEIVFIDSGVRDAQVLVDEIRPGVEVIRLAAGSDGLAQIAERMAGKSGIEAVHIISHGSEGALQLGSIMFSSRNIREHATDLTVIGHALKPDGDILLYGCNVAKGAAGKAFIADVATATGAVVAASINPTGPATLGGDWSLEASTARVVARTLAYGEKYKALLDVTYTTTNTGIDAVKGSGTTLAYDTYFKYTGLDFSGSNIIYADQYGIYNGASSGGPSTALSGTIDIASKTNGNVFNIKYLTVVAQTNTSCTFSVKFDNNATPVTFTAGSTPVTSFTLTNSNRDSVTDNWNYKRFAFTPTVVGAIHVIISETTGLGIGNDTGIASFVIGALPAPAPAPTVTGISPTSGTTAGGTSVTITGTNFNGATSVTIGGVAATGVTVVSATSITATTPAGSAGAKDVVVTTPNGTGTGTGLFTYAAAPTVTGISPTSGATAGGTSVTITGTNLTGATAVKFGTTSATINTNNATQITATSPAGSAGQVDITVVTAGGTSATSASDKFTYVAGAQTATAAAATLTPVAGANDAITLTVKDSLGNTDTSFTGAKNVTISGYQQAPDAGYGSFNGTTLTASPNTIAVTFAGGVASPNLALNKAAAQTIGFSIATVATPATNSPVITPTAGTTASMTVSTNITAPASNGGNFAQQPVITLKDAHGNISAGDNATQVTASKKDAGTWTLTGTTVKTAVNGIATFTNVGATNTAQVLNAQLAFDATGLTQVTSATVTLPAPVGAQTATAAAATLTPVAGANDAITLTVKDSLGNTDTSFTGAKNVTISGYQQAPDAGYGSFNGTTLTASPNTIAVTFAGGVASPNLALNKAAAQTIGFSIATVATPATNSPVITPTAGTTASMTVSTNITAPASNGGNFAQQPVITLKDAHGNISAGDNATQVTASKKDAGTWTLTGTTVKTAVNGIATFTNVGATNTAQVLNAQLAFDATGLTQVTSATVTLPAAPLSTVSTLSNLTLSIGTLAPVFATGTTSYTAHVANATSSITVTPTVSDNTATVKVNGTTVTSGTASGSISLSVGSNNITVVATAQDGVTTSSYTVTVTRDKAAQTLIFNQPTTVTFGGGTVDLSTYATAGLSTGPVIFSIVNGGTGSGTLSGSNNSILTITQAGTIIIQADQNGDVNYADAPSVQQTLTVNKAGQTIGTISFTAPALTIGGNTTVSATATSALAVSFSSLTTGVCTVSNTTVTGVAAGVCTIAADQTGNVNYNGAPRVTNYLTVATTANAVHLSHNSVITDFTTIQDAVDAATDGDTVNIDAGVFVEQVTVTKAITLQGAGIDQTVVKSPVSDSLLQSGGNWKDLKNRDVFALIGIKTNSSSLVTIKNLTVDGDSKGFLSDLRYPDKNLYDFQGIGAFNSTVTIDTVKVTGVRELATDFGQTVPAGYTPTDQPSGMNHNDSIFAESAAGAGTHTLTVTNSTVTKFQKNALLAWGPTLVVDINNNTFQGYGKTIWSTGNALQIASSDRSGLGGANGDRRGTSGSVTNNQILGIGLVIPEPGQDGSYLNLGLLGPSGILLWETANGFQLTGNTITGPGVFSWHSSITSTDGGYGNMGIDIYNSPNTSVTNNAVSGFDVGIDEESAVSGSHVTVSGNTMATNAIDILSASGNDLLTLGSDAEIIGYYNINNGVDTVTGFGTGDKIYVFGLLPGAVNGKISGTPVVDFTGGTVTAGNGSAVAAKSVQVATSGGITTLYVNTNSISGAQLQINLTGVYYPENFALSGGYISFVKTTPVTVATNPAGRSFSVDGTTYTSAQTFNWVANSTHTLATVDLQSGATGTRYDFANWSDSGAMSHTFATPATGTVNATANFVTKYKLTMSTPGNGTVVPAPGDYWYPADGTPAIRATAASGYTFTSWTGAVTSAASSATTVQPLAGPLTVAANFSTAPTSLALTASIGSRSGSYSGDRTWPVTLSKAAGTATNVQVNSVTAASTNPACKPVINQTLSALPVSYGTISAGSPVTRPIVITFTGCPKLTIFNVSIAYSSSEGSGVASINGVTQ